LWRKTSVGNLCILPPTIRWPSEESPMLLPTPIIPSSAISLTPLGTDGQDQKGRFVA
jgi:hypothetical protein